MAKMCNLTYQVMEIYIYVYWKLATIAKYEFIYTCTRKLELGASLINY